MTLYLVLCSLPAFDSLNKSITLTIGQWLFLVCGSLLLAHWLSQLVNDYLWSMVLYSWPMPLYICYLTLCLFSVTPCIQFLIIIVFQPVLPLGGVCWAWTSTSSVFFVPGKWAEKGWQKYSGICGRWSFSSWTLKCICFFRKKQKTDKNRDHAFVMSLFQNCFTTLHFKKKKERKKRKLIFRTISYYHSISNKKL